MKTDEEFQEFKLKMAKRTAATFSICSVIALISLVYGLFQHSEANKDRLFSETALAQANKEIQQLKQRDETSEKMVLDQRQEVLNAIRRNELLEDVVKKTMDDVEACRRSKKIK